MMTRREFNLYLAEHRAEEVAYKLTLLGVCAYWITRYTARDWARRAYERAGGRP